MKLRSIFLPVSILLTAPAALTVMGFTATEARAADKDQSPAKKPINDLEYELKDIARLTTMSNFASSKSAQSAVESKLPDLEKLIADIRKADPKWDVKPYETAIKNAKDALVAAKAAPTGGDGKDKDKSPAKKSITDLEYELKELSRLTSLADFATSKNAQNMVGGKIPDVEKLIADIRKADPKWDVKPYETAVKNAKSALDAAKKGAPPPPPESSGGNNKAASPAFNEINMVEVEMKSATNKMAKSGWETNSDDVRKLKENLVDLDKRIANVKKLDPKWDVKSYESFSKDAWKKQEAAQKAVDAHFAEVDADLKRSGKWMSIRDRWGLAMDAGFRALDKKPRAGMMEIEDDAKRIVALKGLADECVKENYEKVQAKFAKEKRENQPTPVCQMAAGWQKLGKDYVPVVAAAHVQGLGDAHKKAIEQIKKNGFVDTLVIDDLRDPAKYATERHTRFTTATEVLGAKVDRSVFAPLEANAQPLKDAIAEAAKKDAFPKDQSTQDPQLAGPLQADAAKQKIQVIKVRTSGANWAISKNDVGIPTEKWNTGFAKVKVGSEAFCRVIRIEGSATYAGGGTYGAPFIKGGLELARKNFTVSNCP
jgi:hypothetical protein